MNALQRKRSRILWKLIGITGGLFILTFALWYKEVLSSPPQDTPAPDSMFIHGAYLPNIPSRAIAEDTAFSTFQPADLTTTYVNGRFGFGVATSTSAAYEYGLATYINGGWYWDWGAAGKSKIPPLEYVQTIRLSPVKGQVNGTITQIGYTASPTGTTLINRIKQVPGAMWFIGNEPDCNAMDNMLAEFYAYAYHDLYYLIKSIDPTAQIGAGNIVQPTPLRFNYLNRVLDTYQQTYGETLPADFWSTHSYILCENCYPTPHSGDPFAWGACFVPDWNYQHAPDATYYSVYDHWDIDIYASRLMTFRQWLYDNGYRNHPIVIPEYGTLLWPGLVDTTQQDDIDFFNATADWMRTARDSVLGYKPDDNRLVQRWAWYSLDHGSWPGGSLFINNQPTYLGNAYRDYTSAVDPKVEPILLEVSPGIPTPPSSIIITPTLKATIANAGNISTVTPFTVTFYSPSSLQTPTTTIVVDDLKCCGDYKTLTVEIPNTHAAIQQFCVDLQGPDSGQALDTMCYNFKANLQITAWSPVIITSAKNVTATLYTTVINNGDIGTGEPITVSFYVSETLIYPIGNVVAKALDSGETTTVSMTWPNRTAGYHRYYVVARTSYMQTDPILKYQWVNPLYSLYIPTILKP
ncbi:MAG: hypothetical protein JXA33_27850 [Anaerolineae bacterium]|nr:hypothetical protein [Anaerolineae bacterium]